MVGPVTDPVCRMAILPEHAVAAATFEGQRVYFCSESCYEAFLDTPHRYVADIGHGAHHPHVLDLRRVVAHLHPGR